jgi:hypothetical protein
MTKGECAAMLAIAAKAYGKPVDEGTEDVWAQLMGDISWNEGELAMLRHVATSRFFPMICDIRAAVAALRVPPVDLAAAWEEVQKGVRYGGRNKEPQWSHPLIASAVDSMGWHSFCDMTNEQLPTVRAQFAKMLAARTETRTKEANTGALESHLARRGMLSARDLLKLGNGE